MRLPGSNIWCCFRPTHDADNLPNAHHDDGNHNHNHNHNTPTPPTPNIRLAIALRRHSAIAFITGLNTSCSIKDDDGYGSDEEEAPTTNNTNEEVDGKDDTEEEEVEGGGGFDEETEKRLCDQEKKKKRRRRRRRKKRRVRIKEGVGVLIYPWLLLTTHAIAPSIAAVENAEIQLMQLRRRTSGNGDIGIGKDMGAPGINLLLRFKFLPHLFFATNVELNLTVIACEYVTPEIQPMGLDTYTFNPETVEVGAKVYIMGYNLNEIRSENCSGGGGQPRLTIGSGHVVTSGSTHMEVEARDDWWAEGSPGFDAEGAFTFLVTGGKCKNQHVSMRTVMLPTIRSWLEPEWKASIASNSTPNPNPNISINPNIPHRGRCSGQSHSYTPQTSKIRIADVEISKQKSSDSDHDSDNSPTPNNKRNLNPNPNPDLDPNPNPKPDANLNNNLNLKCSLNSNFYPNPKPKPNNKPNSNPNHNNSSKCNLNPIHKTNANPKHSLNLSPQLHHKRFPPIPALKNISVIGVANSPPKASPKLRVSARSHNPTAKLPSTATQTKFVRNSSGMYHCHCHPSNKSHVCSEDCGSGRPKNLHKQCQRETKPFRQRLAELNKI